MTRQRVTVEAATVWSSPHAPRGIDAPAVADDPDLEAWTEALDVEARLGLHGRCETQLLLDEPVEIVEARDEWAHVVAPWQPSPLDDRGYPGWVRSHHLGVDDGHGLHHPPASITADRVTIVDFAQRFKGLRYLWGGLSPRGLDCSGLVHYAYRQAGVVIPRDAHAQHAVAQPVPLGEEQPGDLYFFARPGQQVFHVGFVTARLRMLHAPEAGRVVEDATLSDKRRDVLVGAGRFLG